MKKTPLFINVMVICVVSSLHPVGNGHLWLVFDRWLHPFAWWVKSSSCLSFERVFNVLLSPNLFKSLNSLPNEALTLVIS